MTTNDTWLRTSLRRLRAARRIFVIGNGGGGKTTLSRRIGAALRLPVVHVDSVQFLPGWKRRGEAECDAHLQRVAESDAWVIDGFGSRASISRRAHAADLVVFADLPLWQHYAWAARRQLRARTAPRAELPDDCPEDSAAHTWWLARTLWRVHRTFRPWFLGVLAQLPEERVLRVRSGRRMMKLVRALSASLLLCTQMAVLGNAQVEADGATTAHWSACSDAIEWFARADTPDTEAELMQLVMGGGLVAHSEAWIEHAMASVPPVSAWLEQARATRRPVLWWVTAVEGQHMILPHLLDRYLDIGVFAAPELAALVERRFVAVKCPAGGTLAARFGLTTPAFLQPGLLVLSADGEVLAKLDRCAVFQPEPYAAFLRDVLAGLDDASHSDAFERARAAWTERAGQGDAIAFAREAMLDGDLATAEVALRRVLESSPNDPEATFGLARLAVVRQHEDEATRLLDSLDLEHAAPDRIQAVSLERGKIAQGLGRIDAAAEHFERARSAGGAHTTEAGYRLGATLYATRRENEAVAAWRRAVESDPASIWSARSAAYVAIGTDGLRGEGPLTRGMESLAWSEPLSARDGSRWRRDADDVDDLVARAVAFLLTQQRSSGAWLGSRWAGGGEAAPDDAVGEGPGLFSNIHTAISALTCAALLECNGRVGVSSEAVARALADGERYLLRDDLVVRGDTTAWVYADGFRLLYFARRYPDPDARPAAVRDGMQSWIDELLMQQDETGGSFRHFSYTSTFVTAMVLLGLDEARAAGFDVPDFVYERCADVLEGARDGERGLFGYLLDAPGVNRSPAGAACRQPLCVLALLRCGRTDQADVVAALETFCANYDAFVEPPRKSNFHMTTVGGSAGYFFFHDFLAASMALADCGDRRKEFAARLKQFLLELPEVDGTFLDSGFSYGKSYSTAAALLSLVEIER